MKYSNKKSHSWITAAVMKSGIARSKRQAEVLLVLVSIVSFTISGMLFSRNYSYVIFNPSPEELAHIQAKVIQIESTLRPPAKARL